jgi:hypothetical protein
LKANLPIELALDRHRGLVKVRAWLHLSPVLLGACGPHFDGIRRPAVVSERLMSTLAHGAGTVVNLSDVTPFGWRQVCIAAPYTPLAVLRDSLRVPTDSEVARCIEHRGDIDLLIFRYEHVAPASIPLPRQPGGFAAEVSGRCYSYAEAQFVVRIGSGGRHPEFDRLR